jgi:hypothetical protein
MNKLRTEQEELADMTFQPEISKKVRSLPVLSQVMPYSLLNPASIVGFLAIIFFPLFFPVPMVVFQAKKSGKPVLKLSEDPSTVIEWHARKLKENEEKGQQAVRGWYYLIVHELMSVNTEKEKNIFVDSMTFIRLRRRSRRRWQSARSRPRPESAPRT